MNDNYDTIIMEVGSHDGHVALTLKLQNEGEGRDEHVLLLGPETARHLAQKMTIISYELEE